MILQNPTTAPIPPTASTATERTPSTTPPAGPPQVDLGSYADHDALIAVLRASGPLDNEDVAAVAEG